MEQELKLGGLFYKEYSDTKNYSPEIKDCIESVVKNLLKSNTNTSKPISLLGKVQSGKTATFIGIIALAFDNDYDVSIILTKNSITLAEQTLIRVSNEFKSFCDDDRIFIFDIMKFPDLTSYQIDKKLIFIVKKEDDNLRNLEDLFLEEHPQLKEKNVLIIDDEADWASVGFTGKVANIELSKVAEQIKNFRQILNDNSDFLQVTATPYNLYLQPESYEGGYSMRPEHIQIMPTYPSYIGGIEYFEKSENENSVYSHLYQEVREDELSIFESMNARYPNQILTHEKLFSFRSAIVNFIVGAAIRNLSEERDLNRPIKFSSVIHIDVNKKVHDWIKTSLVEGLISAYKENISLFETMVWVSYEEIIRSYSKVSDKIPSLESVTAYSIQSLEKIRILKVNSDEDIKNYIDKNTGQLKLLDPLNIFIGAFILDRGLTIDNLISFFYGRNPQKFQQDTIMQHLRVYGNRSQKDMGVTRLYTTHRIYKALASTHRLDEEMRKAILENDFNRIIAIFRDNNGDLKPTNPSKLRLSKIETIKPRGRIVPTHFWVKKNQVSRNAFQEINALLNDAKKDVNFDSPFLVETEIIFKIIDKIEKTFTFEEGENFNFQAMKHIIRTTAREQHSFQTYVFVRENREISRIAPGDLRYTSSPESDDIRETAYQTAETLPVLMLLGQKGEKRSMTKMKIEYDIGWDDQPFFWPVLFTPRNMKPFIFESGM